jgi:hypothetical protein
MRDEGRPNRIVVFVNEGDDWGDRTDGWWKLAEAEIDDPREAVRHYFADYGSKPRKGDTKTYIAATCGPGHPWQEWKVIRRFSSVTESVEPIEAPDA